MSEISESSCDEWFHQYIYEMMPDILTVNGEYLSLMPSRELCELAFKPTTFVEDECIDPAVLQLQRNDNFWHEDYPPLYVAQEHGSQIGQYEASSEAVSFPRFSPCLSFSEFSEPEPMEIDAEKLEVSDSSPFSVPFSPIPPAPCSPISRSSEETSDDVYPVEKILQSWGPKSRRQYLIRWQGWGPEFDCWEPACSLSDDLIMEFEVKRLSRGRPRK